MNRAAELPLIPEPLTESAFAPFGDVIDLTGAVSGREINYGTTERIDLPADINTSWNGGRTGMSLFRGLQATPLPFNVRFLERHPHSSQAFLALAGSKFLVVVAPPGPAPAPAGIRAFLTNGAQGVNYRAGVWHHPLLALRQGDIFLVVDRMGPGENCDEHTFDSPGIVLLNAGQMPAFPS